MLLDFFEVPVIVIVALASVSVFCAVACAANWHGRRKRRMARLIRLAASEARAAKIRRDQEEKRTLQSNYFAAKENATPTHTPTRRIIRESPAAIRNRQQAESTDDDLLGAMMVGSMVTGSMLTEPDTGEGAAYSEYEGEWK